MITGIWVALILLTLGFISVLACEGPAEGRTAITFMLAVTLVLVLTLFITNQPKTVAEELEALQRHCIRQGIATMTPVVTQSKFQLLPVTIAEAEIECGSTTAEMSKR
jgi:hypothetical protein